MPHRRVDTASPNISQQILAKRHFVLECVRFSAAVSLTQVFLTSKKAIGLPILSESGANDVFARDNPSENRARREASVFKMRNEGFNCLLGNNA